MYTQKELMSPPELGQLNQLGKLAEQLATRTKIEYQTKCWLSSKGNKIEVIPNVHRWATVEELMNTGYRISDPKNLFRERHQRETWPQK